MHRSVFHFTYRHQSSIPGWGEQIARSDSTPLGDWKEPGQRHCFQLHKLNEAMGFLRQTS
jgi:hypothetical protein